jgi:exonuclease VII small subunit
LWGNEPEEEPEASAPRPNLESRVTALEREIDELKRAMESFRRQFE